MPPAVRVEGLVLRPQARQPDGQQHEARDEHGESDPQVGPEPPGLGPPGERQPVVEVTGERHSVVRGQANVERALVRSVRR